MKRMIIDVSSVVKRCLYVGKDEENGYKVVHEGKEHLINSHLYAHDNAVNSIVAALETFGLKPSDLIFVSDGMYAKARRQNFYPGYKEPSYVPPWKEGKANKVPATRPPQWNDEFNKARASLLQAFRDVGASAAGQNGVEADDIIAFLTERLEGEVIIFSEDGDLSQLISERVSMYRQGARLTVNPYGPFSVKRIAVWKALVGDSSDNYHGAVGFGEKAFLDLLVNFGEKGLAGLEGMMQRRTLHELEDDVSFFKPFRKVIDGAEHVYQSYDVAKLRPEWVDTERLPLQWTEGAIRPRDQIEDGRLRRWGGSTDEVVTVKAPEREVSRTANAPARWAARQHKVFDVELIGRERPVFLVCTEVVETGEKESFWWHVDGDMARLAERLKDPAHTWVSFNGAHFDAPIVSAAIDGKNPLILKRIADALINEGLKSWQCPDRFEFPMLDFDHIDLFDVAPGVGISLKAYAGRMGYPTMIDLPFEHDHDLDAEEMKVLEHYCSNDLGVTIELFKRLSTEVELRREMSQEYDIDLRSKSDAQVAEAVLRKVLGIRGRGDAPHPRTVTYKAPSFIQTDSPVINELIHKLETCAFTINRMNGAVECPKFLDEPLQLGFGTYQCGIGGLHSTHDRRRFVEATGNFLISDFDVASYYPNIMMKAGLIPELGGGKGADFIAEYSKIYDRRLEAKRAKNKKVANSLKITLNGTFGKLGSIFSAFYAPELMLAVTLTGQLNLLCLIHEIEKTGAMVISANTDGIMVGYVPGKRSAVLGAIVDNVLRTGFEYEETAYSTVAMKDVNNYIAITADRSPVVVSNDGTIKDEKADPGKAKRKGLYASTDPKENPLYLMKNPTMQVCSNLAAHYLKTGEHPRDAILAHRDIRDYVSIRNVKGGGVQRQATTEVDDWVLIDDLGTKDNTWHSPRLDKAVKRKSRPKPVAVGIGGKPFGRMARWYMTTEELPPITYVGSGNTVPKTEGAKVCMALPAELPEDLDLDWYVRETLSILDDLGVVVDEEQEVAIAA